MHRSAILCAAGAFLCASCGSERLPDGDAPPPEQMAEPVAPLSETQSPASTEPSALSDAYLTAEGWGPLRIGMSQAEVTEAVGPQANPDLVAGAEPDVCQQYKPSETPEGVYVMIERDKLTRISLIRDADILTDAGLKLGATTDEVRAAYTTTEVTPHKYQESPAVYLDAWMNVASGDQAIDNPEARGIRYVVNTDGVVESIHAGGSSIRYVEGCL